MRNDTRINIALEEMMKIHLDDLEETFGEEFIKKSGRKPPNRGKRRKETERVKKRRKVLYGRYGEGNYAYRNWYDHDPVINVSPVFAGSDKPVVYIKKGKKPSWEKAMKKVDNRKIRHKIFSEEEL